MPGPSPHRAAAAAAALLAILAATPAFPGLRGMLYSYQCAPALLTEENVLVFEVEGDRARVRHYGNVIYSMDGGYMRPPRYGRRFPTLAEAEDSLRYDECDLIDLARGRFLKLDPADRWYEEFPIRPAVPDTTQPGPPPPGTNFVPVPAERALDRAARAYRISMPDDTTGMLAKLLDLLGGEAAREQRAELLFVDRDPLLDRWQKALDRLPELESEFDSTRGDFVEVARRGAHRDPGRGLEDWLKGERGAAIGASLGVAWTGPGAEDTVKAIARRMSGGATGGEGIFRFEGTTLVFASGRLIRLEEATFPASTFELPPGFRALPDVRKELDEGTRGRAASDSSATGSSNSRGSAGSSKRSPYTHRRNP